MFKPYYFRNEKYQSFCIVLKGKCPDKVVNVDTFQL